MQIWRLARSFEVVTICCQSDLWTEKLDANLTRCGGFHDSIEAKAALHIYPFSLVEIWSLFLKKSRDLGGIFRYFRTFPLPEPPSAQSPPQSLTPPPRPSPFLG